MTFVFCGAVSAADKGGDGKYAPVTLQNVSDALFKIGVLRASDPLAVDEYVRIHHCGLYEQYGADDIAWTHIREAQARDLTLKTPSLNENLEVKTSLILGDYDYGASQFPLTPATALQNMGLVSVIEVEGGNFMPCGDDSRPFVPRAHPFHLTTRISTPLTLTSLPVSRTTAEALVKIIKAREENRAQRSVMMVMHIHLNGPDPLSGSTDSSNMTVIGDLDDIEVYDGPERNLLLYSKKFTTPQAAKTDLR